MSTLRRLLPSLAALLAVLVVVQTTDLVACADEAVAAASSETHTDVLANGGHPVPVPGDSHDDEHEHEEGKQSGHECSMRAISGEGNP